MGICCSKESNTIKNTITDLNIIEYIDPEPTDQENTEAHKPL